MSQVGWFVKIRCRRRKPPGVIRSRSYLAGASILPSRFINTVIHRGVNETAESQLFQQFPPATSAASSAENR